MSVESPFCERYWEVEAKREDDERDDYQRDKARIIHSAAFRRLQAKTQVMGVGEGDFHRTRLTHSMETAQIGDGILEVLRRRYQGDSEISEWLPTRDLLEAACFAHDLGHPPFGHGGERALHARMFGKGGFEGNGQTLRILTRLEKYIPNHGMNPTRRMILSVLKYPIKYSDFEDNDIHAPKCYFDQEEPIVKWALSEPFSKKEYSRITTEKDKSGKARHRTLDCSVMEYADDIAYAVHDLEDIVGRNLVEKEDVLYIVQVVLKKYGGCVGNDNKGVNIDDFKNQLFSCCSHKRKKFIGRLVNLFVTSSKLREEIGFDHPLLKYRVEVDESLQSLLKCLKRMAYDLVVKHAEIQQLERRGQRIVGHIFDEIADDPKSLIPKGAWADLDSSDTESRRVCDYVAGMTDRYAERIYQRLFIPGIGSSRDEL